MKEFDLLAYYCTAGVFTDIDPLSHESLPGAVADIVHFVQNLLIHEALATMYHVSLSEDL